MDEVFCYINYTFLKQQDLLREKIYYNFLFYVVYETYNINWSKNSVYELIHNLKNYLDIQNECIIVSIIYMERLVVSGFKITHFNLRNTFIICVFISYKFLIDSKISLNIYSKITKLHKKYIKNMELYVLKQLDYKLFIDKCFYEKILYIILNFKF